jgi:molecular chaperone DnaK
MLKDAGEKVQAADKTEVEAALADAKKTLEGSPATSELRSAHEKLTLASHKLAEAMYKATSAQSQSGPTDAGAAGPTAGDAKKEGEVIDAEYVDVDDKK